MNTMKNLKEFLPLCFLNNVYEDKNTGEQFYELIKSDPLFTSFSITVTDAEGLKDTTEKFNTDFDIVSGYLCVQRDMETLQCTQEVRDRLNQVQEIKIEPGTLYDLINKGIDKQWIIVSDRYVDAESLDCVGIAPFTSIQFGRETMECYVPIVEEDGIHNKMLVKYNKGSLRVEPFYFAAETKVDYEGTKFVKTVVCKDTVRYIYLVESAKILPEECVVSIPCINHAVNKVEGVGKPAIKAIQYLLQSEGIRPLSYIADEDNAGATSNLASKYGITFELLGYVPDEKRFEELKSIVENEVLLGCLTSMGVLQECENVIHKFEFQDVDEVILIYYAIILFAKRRGFGPSIESAASALSVANEINVTYSMYLYQIRVAAFLAGIPLFDEFNEVLAGGSVDTCTLVHGGFKYGID